MTEDAGHYRVSPTPEGDATVMVFWDPHEGRGVLTGGQSVGLPPMLFMTPDGRWLNPRSREVPDWWGSGWDFAMILRPLPDADIRAIIDEARRDFYSGPIDEL